MTIPSNEPNPITRKVLGIDTGAGQPFYMTGEDRLRIVTAASVAGITVRIAGRFLTIGGELTVFEEEQTPGAARVPVTREISLGDGWLLNLEVFHATTGAQLGATYSSVRVVRGGLGALRELAALIQGFCNFHNRMIWPNAQNTRSTEGEGLYRVVTGTNPAAGVEVIETVPAGAIWRPVSLQAILVTDATVINRAVRFALDDGASEYYRSPGLANHPASTTVTYSAASNATIVVAGIDTTLLHALPQDLRMLAGHRIRTATANLQAGDNWSAPVMLIQEWLAMDGTV